VGSCPLFVFLGAILLTHTSVAVLVDTGAATGADRVPPLETIRTIAERVTRTRGLEVWDIQSRREQSGHVVRVVIDRPGPAATPEESVSVEDCAEVNRELSTILDVEDPLPFTYVLEVSSPGLDRPLREPADYERFAGRLAKLVVKEAVDNQKAFEGRLRGVERGAGAAAGDAAGDIVLLEALNGRIHKLPLKLITRGRLEVEF
jgi:ribosome maturation factor RimP